MARSRNIKPGFFTNEEIVELPFSTRLLFIGLWTLADRAGRLEDRPKRIKMAIFPADELDIGEGLNGLQDHGFITRYEVNGNQYIQILAFSKHQNPHIKEPASLIPEQFRSGSSTVQAPDENHASHADSPLPITDSPLPINTLVSNDVADACPHQEIIDLYHQYLPMLTKVKTWTAKRTSLLKARWREDKSRQNLDYWGKLFRYIAESDFLTGRATDFQADLEWIINSSNLVKIIEGKYENKQEAA